MPAPNEAMSFEPYDYRLVQTTNVNVAGARRDFNAWYDGKSVSSRSLAVATINPPEETLAVLYEGLREEARIAVPGLPFGANEESEHEWMCAAWDRLDPAVRPIIGSIAASLTAVVHADIARSPGTRMPNGRGEVRTKVNASPAGLWHVDNLPTSTEEGIFESGMRRYVVAFGSLNDDGTPPTTRFLHGSTTQAEARRIRDTQEVPAKFREFAHPIGTVACFSSNFGLHRTPETKGPRLFLTLSSIIVSDRTPPQRRN